MLRRDRRRGGEQPVTVTVGVRVAAIYIRVSRLTQAEGHSPAVQEEGCRRVAEARGYVVPDHLVREDHERGGVVSREGYQDILRLVREGKIAVVIVYMFDRWGRDAAEWLARSKELRRLGVPLISVVQGPDQGGMMSVMYAGMAEEYSLQLAQRVIPGRTKGAREGTHQGPTPFGYARVYVPWDGKGRRPAGTLVADPATAPIVGELFRRYAAGGWSILTLTRWLNDNYPHLAPRAGLPSRRRHPVDVSAAASCDDEGGRWSTSTVYGILRCVAYKGWVSINAKPQGAYATSADDSYYEGPGTHEAIVEPEVWDAIQERLRGANTMPSRNRVLTTGGRPVALAVGILRCGDCGSPMTYAWHAPTTRRGPQYLCSSRRQGRLCTGRGYHADHAHEALLRVVGCLRGRVWTEDAERFLLEGGEEGDAAGRDARVAAERALVVAREEMVRLLRQSRALIDEPEAVQSALRADRAALAARIDALVARVEGSERRVSAVVDWHALHRRLIDTDLSAYVQELRDAGDIRSLRELTMELVTAARVVERRPERNSTWLRVEVTWTPAVAALLCAGLLSVDATDRADGPTDVGPSARSAHPPASDPGTPPGTPHYVADRGQVPKVTDNRRVRATYRGRELSNPSLGVEQATP